MRQSFVTQPQPRGKVGDSKANVSSFYFCIKPGAVARSVAMPYWLQAVPRSILAGKTVVVLQTGFPCSVGFLAGIFAEPNVRVTAIPRGWGVVSNP